MIDAKTLAIQADEAETIQAGEVKSIARLMAHTYDELVRFYVKEQKLSLEDAQARAKEPKDEMVAHFMSQLVDQIDWLVIRSIADVNPDKAYAKWEEIKQTAREELASGGVAASALGHNGAVPGHPLERARFLAIRESFIADWKPTGGIEQSLLDTLALAYAGQLFWLERLQVRVTFEAVNEDYDIRREGNWKPSRISDVEAQQRAAEMMDRYNRLLLRTLRGLRDLRRYAPVVIQNAGQVNIGYLLNKLG